MPKTKQITVGITYKPHDQLRFLNKLSEFKCKKYVKHRMAYE